MNYRLKEAAPNSWLERGTLCRCGNRPCLRFDRHALNYVLKWHASAATNRMMVRRSEWMTPGSAGGTDLPPIAERIGIRSGQAGRNRFFASAGIGGRKATNPA